MYEISPRTQRPGLTASKNRRGVVVVALSLSLLVTGTSAAFARGAPGSFADLAEQVSPAVVNIAVTHALQTAESRGGAQGGLEPFMEESPFQEFFERFYGNQTPQAPMPRQRPHRSGGVGSGFLIDAEGYVVTNLHVVDKAAEVTVTMSDGRSFDADIIGSDRRTDLALLKVEAEEPLPFVAFGDSDEVRVGDWVMAVGNPFGLGGTVTAGIVSARGRDLRGDTLVDFLQTDAPINRGNSGGPAFDQNGNVVGINTAIYSPNGGSIGLGFAIPSNDATSILAQLRESGKVERGWLGVRIQPVTEEIAEGFDLDKPRGALIASIEEDSPAEGAGLRAGDIILTWNGKDVAKVKDLSRLVAATPTDVESELAIWRGGETIKLQVVTGTYPEQQAAIASDNVRVLPTGIVEIPKTGLAVAPLTEERRDRFGFGEDVFGVLVAEVKPHSNAAKAGLRSGDVISGIASDAVEGPEDFVEGIESSLEAGHEAVLLLVLRAGNQSYLSLPLNQA